jgi:hypothetical protein
LTQTSAYTDLLIAKIGSDISTNIPPTSAESKKIKQFDVFPNPAHDMFLLNYKGLSTAQIQINVFNTLGLSVYAEKIAYPPKEFTKNIDLTKEAKGIYYIEIIVDDEKSVKKIVLN